MASKDQFVAGFPIPHGAKLGERAQPSQRPGPAQQPAPPGLWDSEPAQLDQDRQDQDRLDELYRLLEDHQQRLDQWSSGRSGVGGVAKSEPEAQPTHRGAKFYSVAKGDTLGSIASKFSIPASELASFNKLSAQAIGKMPKGSVVMIPQKG